MITTFNPQYGHFLVKKAPSVDVVLGGTFYISNNKTAYGVFRINHALYSYDDPENNDPRKAHKVDLEPVGNTAEFQRRDWYACDVLNKMAAEEGKYHVFDDFQEAINWAADMNNIKEVK